MNTDFKKAKGLLEGSLVELVEATATPSSPSTQTITLDDIQGKKEDLRTLLQIDWRKMMFKVTARENVDAILAKQDCSSDMKYEAKYEAAVAAHKAAVAEAKATEASTADGKGEGANGTVPSGQDTTGDPLFDADYKAYLKLLPDATYGTNMASRVKEATTKIEAIHSAVLSCLNKSGAVTGDTNQMLVEEVDTSSDVEMTNTNLSAKKPKSSPEDSNLAAELLDYIFGSDDPEVKRQRLEEEQKRKERKEAEEKLNAETRAKINAEHNAQEEKIAEEKRLEEEAKREEEERKRLEGVRRKMVEEYDEAEMAKREEAWSQSDPNELLSSVITDLVRLSLGNFKSVIMLFHGLVETIVKRPEDLGGNYSG